MWGIISSILIAVSFIISKKCLNGEHLGEMAVASVFIPFAIHIFNKTRKCLKDINKKSN